SCGPNKKGRIAPHRRGPSEWRGSARSVRGGWLITRCALSARFGQRRASVHITNRLNDAFSESRRSSRFIVKVRQRRVQAPAQPTTPMADTLLPACEKCHRRGQHYENDRQ